MKYTKPSMELIKFSDIDVLTTSEVTETSTTNVVDNSLNFEFGEGDDD